jgi:hypothetical protein
VATPLLDNIFAGFVEKRIWIFGRGDEDTAWCSVLLKLNGEMTMNMKHTAKAALLALGLSMAISGVASAQCSSGWIANALCETGFLTQEQANLADLTNARLGNPVDRAVLEGVSAGANYIVPGSGELVRGAWVARDAVSRGQRGQSATSQTRGNTNSYRQSADPYSNQWGSQQPRMTTRCYFQTGFMAGQVFDFAGMAAPMSIGGLCNDGMGGLGVAVQ